MFLFRLPFTRMRIKKFTWAMITVPLLLISTPLAAAEDSTVTKPLPDYIQGNWKVKSVRLDLSATRRIAYQWDDPRLMKGIFKIDNEKIFSTIFEMGNCTKPTAAEWNVGADKLIELSIAWHDYPGIAPKAEDFELPLKPDENVKAFMVKCESGQLGPPPSGRLPAPFNTKNFGSWIIYLGKDELAMKWYDETVLILHRLKGRAPRH